MFKEGNEGTFYRPIESDLKNYEAEEHVLEYLHNIKLMKTIANANGVHFINIVQPIEFNLLSKDKHISASEIKSIKLFLNRVSEMIKTDTAIEYYVNAFSQKNFVDGCHLSDAGYKQLAYKISKTLKVKKIL